jgi:antirestriction protein ArdC
VIARELTLPTSQQTSFSIRRTSLLQPGSLVVYANSITKTEQSRKQWGDEGYAREELVAELPSAFLCAELGITPEVMPDHASYIANWLTVLKNDKRAIFSAAAHAQKAAEYLHGRKTNCEAEAA